MKIFTHGKSISITANGYAINQLIEGIPYSVHTVCARYL